MRLLLAAVLSIASTLALGQGLPSPNLSPNTKVGGVVLAPSATVDATNAGNITAGTLPAARLPLVPPANGGCGAASLTGILKGNGASPCTPAVPGTDFITPNGNLGGPGLDPRATAEIQVTPKFCDYGVLNGVDSNNACVQAAIDYACSPANSLNGTLIAGKLVFGRFKYKLTGVGIPKSCAGLVLQGQGSGGTGGTIIYSDNSCLYRIFNFYPDATANYVIGGGIRDMHFYNNKPYTGDFTGATSCSQPLIQANFGRNMVFERITSVSPYQLIKLVGGLNYTLNDIEANVALPNSPGVIELFGYGTASAASPTRQDVVNIKNFLMFSAQPQTGGKYANGIWQHGFSVSLRTVNTAMTTVHTALKIDCSADEVAANLRPDTMDACPSFGRFANFETEASGGNAIDIQDAYHMDFWSTYVACYARTSTASPYTSGCNNAVRVGNGLFSNTGTFNFVSGVINNAQASGIFYEGYKLNVSGGMNVYGNNAANVGASNIVIATPPSGKKFGSHSITGNTLCSGPNDNLDNQTAISIQPGNDWISFTGNILKGCNANAAIVSPSGIGAHSTITPNLGP